MAKPYIHRTPQGLVHKLEPDSATGGLIVATTQPGMGDVIEANKAAQTHNDGYSPSRDLRRVASIPLWVIQQWRTEGLDFNNENHWPAIQRKLNSSEYLWLRTAPGRV